MTRNIPERFDIDNSSILYLALIRKNHTNIYRFSFTLTEDIRPDILQSAVNRVYRRFPTIIAGFQPGFFHYSQVPVKEPPQVTPDPGCLITMSREEIARSTFRVFYRDNHIHFEDFHAAADGYGAVAAFSTIVAEYLRLCYDVQIPTGYPILDVTQGPQEEELEDSYLNYAGSKPLHMPSRYSYQLPGGNCDHDGIYENLISYPVNDVLTAARRHSVSITALLSAVMASSIMEVQKTHTEKLKPVRIMVPIDLRRIFPSKTLRNFILYALPTMEPQKTALSITELSRKFAGQIKAHLEKDNLSGIMAYNVKTQNSLLFKAVPSKLKCTLMRLAYKFFGESNSSLTITNLGNIALPEEMIPYVKAFHITMTPRSSSPYNCAMFTYNGQFFLNICRFPEKSELEGIFMKRLHAVLYDEDASV